jgi:hypothetical protein
MKNTDDRWSALNPVSPFSSSQPSAEGMTLRDYFAANAPQAPDDWREGINSINNIIDWRWHYANRMLKAREA